MALTDNLVSYWKLDESSGTAADSVGSNTLTNNSVSFASGKINNGASFNGSSNYFSLSDPSANKLPLTGNATFSFWVKPAALGNEKDVLSKYSDGKRSFQIWWNADGTMRMQTTSDGGTGTRYGDSVVWSTGLSVGVWTHVVFIYTYSTHSVKCYANGTDLGTPSGYAGYATGIYNGSADFQICGVQGASNLIYGMVDEVGIWSRALTSTEVTQLYNAGAGMQPSFSTTSTATTTGKARIQKSVTQTIAGKGRVTATATRNETGLSRISKTVLQTIAGVARIRKTVTQTVAGVANVSVMREGFVQTSQGPRSPSAATTLSGAAWVNTGNLYASDNAYARSSVQGDGIFYGTSTFDTAQLTKDGSTLVGTNLGPGLYTETETTISLGGATNLWGTTWTPAEINASTFGFVIDASSSKWSEQMAGPLVVSGFSFSIPTNATINGIAVGVEQYAPDYDYVYIDHISITVYYTGPFTGTARITAAVARTIAGISRLTASTAKTITGVASIVVTVSTNQTITGISRITALATRVIDGVARIQKTATGTETGIARVTAAATQNETGTARVTATAAAAETGLARVTATAARTETGLSRITAIATRTASGISRVTRSVAQTLLGVARITASTTRTEDGTARVTATAQQAVTGKSRLTTSESQTEIGRARVTNSTTATETGTAAIIVTYSSSQTETGAARVTATTAQTETGVGRIQRIVSALMTGTARVQTFVDRIQTGVSRVTAAASQAETGTARIQTTSTAIEEGASRITATSAQGETGQSRLTATTTRTEAGVASVLLISSATSTGTARIETVVGQSIGGVARIASRINSIKYPAILTTKPNEAVLTTRQAPIVLTTRNRSAIL